MMEIKGHLNPYEKARKKIRELAERVKLLQNEPEKNEAEIKELTAEINRLLDESIAARLD